MSDDLMDVALAVGVVAPGTEVAELTALLAGEPCCQWQSKRTGEPLCSAPAVWQGATVHEGGDACRTALACDAHRLAWIRRYAARFPGPRTLCGQHRTRLTLVEWRPL